jgi:hypothetical protein
MNVQLYWKYLVGLLIYAIVLNIPFLIYIDVISNAITNFFSIHEKNNEIGYVIYGMMVIIQLPLMVQLLQNVLYEILYALVIILVGIFNPFEFLTTPYKPRYLFILIILLFIALRFTPHILKVFLLVLMAATSTNEILSFYFKPKFIFLAYIIVYVIGYAVCFITLNPERFRILFNFVDWIKNKLFYLWLRFKQLIFMILSAPSVYLGAIAVLIGFALIHLYIRTIAKYTYGGELLVHKPIPLDKVTSYEIPISYHYTLSFWFYIHPTAPSYSLSSTEYSTLLLHGDNVLVTYNGEKNKLDVKLKGDSMVSTRVPLQKWNHVALIYTNGIMDTLMNGKLIKSDTWVPHILTKDLMIGAQKGIHGDICNVLYYDEVKTHDFVKALYKEFKNMNPPIV